MKFLSNNIFSDFEFHDAYFKLEGFENKTLTVSVQYLNIHKNTEQNPCDTDMEIENARITFHNFRAISFEPGRAWQYDANGNRYTDDPLVIFEGEAAVEKLLNELRTGTTVLTFEPLDNGNIYLDGTGSEPYFESEFMFDCATIQWDAFKKPAWYEERPFKK